MIIQIKETHLHIVLCRFNSVQRIAEMIFLISSKASALSKLQSEVFLPFATQNQKRFLLPIFE
jgi:hypothetical protein